MIVLIVSACLAGAPTQCGEHRIAFFEATAEQCRRVALPLVSRWAGLHPALAVRDWNCDAEDKGDPS